MILHHSLHSSYAPHHTAQTSCPAVNKKLLQIKKASILSSLNYQLTFLSRQKSFQKMFHLKRQLTTAVFLRSPKHFNIGKHKLVSLNFKNINLKVYPTAPVPMGLLLKPTGEIFSLLIKPIAINTTILPKSLKVTILTQFKLIWLEF